MEETTVNTGDQKPRLRQGWLSSLYFIKTPWWVKRIYTSYLWHVNTKEKIIYLSFDDGPHPTVTRFVLQQLKQFDALATFFCVGNNVVLHPDVYKEILDGGHSVGNHTQNHVNGWKVSNAAYMKDIAEAARHIDSNLFRPPYGKITYFQSKQLRAAMQGKKAQVVMWDVLSADFDEAVTPEQCLSNVVLKAGPGSIIVFHDSEKAFEKLSYALPKVLHHFSKLGYRFEALPVK
jgi:peptidoglycan/xylan/chitin deacetylase (PgdA/CDA1 family)